MASKDSTTEYKFLPLTPQMKDLTGQKFGRLVALGVVGRRNNSLMWLCECECGGLAKPLTYSLTSGHTRSCGCLSLEIGNQAKTTHGRTDTLEYRRWCRMKGRCYNPQSDKYTYYGGRGITVCARWRNSFENFYADMGPCPDGHSIERKDNLKDYSPSNCVWASQFEQANNKRSNIILTYKGQSLTVAQWSRETGVPYGTLWARVVTSGWSTAKALTTPIRRRKT